MAALIVVERCRGGAHGGRRQRGVLGHILCDGGPRQGEVHRLVGQRTDIAHRQPHHDIGRGIALDGQYALGVDFRIVAARGNAPGVCWVQRD